jgi:ubiquinone/menaquinone biosynthesis C-methylase UbiE
MSYQMWEMHEHDSAYFLQDRSNIDDIARLKLHDKILTRAIHGVLEAFTDHAFLMHVLDVGCGTGGWLCDLGKRYSMIERLVGADISNTVLASARQTAQANQLEERVQFRVMDALRRLDFPSASFDLIHLRAGICWLRKWEWTKLLLECRRVVRPGGTIWISEMNVLVESNSPALTQLCNISLKAFAHSGRIFVPESDGLTSQLVHLLTQCAFENIETRTFPLVYQAGTDAGQDFYEYMWRFYRLAVPFFQKWTTLPDNYQQIYQQALSEMLRSDFVATWTWVSVKGTRPLYGEPLLMRGLR